MKINEAIKKLNEDYETLDRIDGEAVIDPTTAKAKKEAEEGKENIEKVMEETTPEEIKDPKMPKTKDLKVMGLQESLNTLLEGYIEDTTEHDFLVEYLDNYGDLNRLEVTGNDAQAFFNEIVNMNLVNDFSKILLFEIDDATIYKDQDYEAIVDEFDFDEFTGEFTKKEESFNNKLNEARRKYFPMMFDSPKEYGESAVIWVENEGQKAVFDGVNLKIIDDEGREVPGGVINMVDLFNEVRDEVYELFEDEQDEFKPGATDEDFWVELFYDKYDQIPIADDDYYIDMDIDESFDPDEDDEDAFLSGGLVLSEDENDWDISSTNDLELFADSPSYYKTLAKLQLRNFGKIYYWTNKLEPLEVEDVIDYELEESLNEDSGQRAVRYFNRQVHGKLDGIERPTLGDYIKALEEE